MKKIFLAVFIFFAIFSTQLFSADSDIIFKYSFSLVETIGGYGSTTGLFIEPTGITQDNRFLFICDSGNKRIVRIDSILKTMITFDSLPENLTTLDNPGRILIYNQNVLVSDISNHRLISYSYDGKYQNSYGSVGLSQAQFNKPMGLAKNIAGKIFVCDANNDRVQVFDNRFLSLSSEDALLNSFLFEFGQDHLNCPTDILITEDSSILVSDSANNFLKLFDSFGNLKKIFFQAPNMKNFLSSPRGIAEDNDRNFYVIDGKNKRIVCFDLDEKILGVINTNLSDPIGIAIYNDLIYITDKAQHKVLVFKRGSR